MVQDGHEIGNHSWTHARPLAGLTRAELEDEIATTSDLIEEVTARRPSLFRAPWLVVDEFVLDVVGDAGMHTSVGVSVLPRDYELLDREPIVHAVVSATRPGSIVVLHDGAPAAVRSNDSAASRRATAAAVPRILAETAGLTFVTVSELIATAHGQPKSLGS